MQAARRARPMAALSQPSNVACSHLPQPRSRSMQLNKPGLAAAPAVAITPGTALAQDLFAYPPQGRAQPQQQQDQFECHQWAVEQTHFDPVQYAADPASGQGSTASAAAAP